MELESYAKFTAQEPLTRTSLAKALETLEAAAVPVTAKLEILNFHNAQGFVVKARWTTELEDTK